MVDAKEKSVGLWLKINEDLWEKLSHDLKLTLICLEYLEALFFLWCQVWCVYKNLKYLFDKKSFEYDIEEMNKLLKNLQTMIFSSCIIQTKITIVANFLTFKKWHAVLDIFFVEVSQCTFSFITEFFSP